MATPTPTTNLRTDDARSVQHRLEALRASHFHGKPAHREAAGRLRRQARQLLADNPSGPDAAGLTSAIELIDGLIGCGPGYRTAS